MDVQGTVADGFEPVREAFERNFDERGEVGAAVTIHHEGRPVVDLWAGEAEADRPGRPWERDTAQVIRSAGKGMAAGVLLTLHQRGQLDLDAPVSTYWPQFKANGKEGALVRHLLTHRVGVPALDRPLTAAEALDGVTGPAAVAAQRPFWTPGEDHGYHAQTFSWLLGELVLRATGRTLGRWFDQEVARPLGLDLWIGLPDAERHRTGRVAPVTAPPAPASAGLRARPKRSVADAYADPGSLTSRSFGAIAAAGGTVAAPGLALDENDPAYLSAELPASNAVATARSLSCYYAALTGKLNGRPALFAPATLTAARSVESEGPDRVLVVNTRFGHGYMLHGPSCPLLGPGSFGHPGRGGSLGFAAPDQAIAFGYVTNGLQRSVTADPRAQALVRALRGCLADPG